MRYLQFMYNHFVKVSSVFRDVAYTHTSAELGKGRFGGYGDAVERLEVLVDVP